jgi:hypothetical protein
MFATHQKQIELACLENIDAFTETLHMVISSIRNPFHRLPVIMNQQRTMGIEAPSLQQNTKLEGYLFTIANKKFLYQDMYHNNLSVAEQILSMTSIPRIGS